LPNIIDCVSVTPFTRVFRSNIYDKLDIICNESLELIGKINDLTDSDIIIMMDQNPDLLNDDNKLFDKTYTNELINEMYFYYLCIKIDNHIYYEVLAMNDTKLNKNIFNLLKYKADRNPFKKYANLANIYYQKLTKEDGYELDEFPFKVLNMLKKNNENEFGVDFDYIDYFLDKEYENIDQYLDSKKYLVLVKVLIILSQVIRNKKDLVLQYFKKTNEEDKEGIKSVIIKFF